MVQRYQLFIDNEWVDPASGRWFDSLDPFSGEAVGGDSARRLKRCRAVRSRPPRTALDGPWGRMSASDRGMLLHKLGALIERDADTLAEVESRDNGKLTQRSGRRRSATWRKYFYYYGGLADKIQGAVIPMDKPKVFNYTRYEPLGVVVDHHAVELVAVADRLEAGACALCAGNTVIAKPSEYTSASLLELAKLVRGGRFPARRVQRLTGFGKEVGEPLVTIRRSTDRVHRRRCGGQGRQRARRTALQARLARAGRQVPQHRLR